MASDDGNHAIDRSREHRLAEYCLDQAPVCVFRLDQEGRILYANRKAADCLGYSRSALLKMSLVDIAPTENRDKWLFDRLKLCAHGCSTFEGRLRREDGVVLPFEVSANLMEFEGHRHSMAFCREISKRERTPDLLHLPQYIYDKAPFGIFLTMGGGYIANVNAYACNYLGYDKEELCRMNMLQIDQCYSRQEIGQIWLRVQKEGVIVFESIHRRKDGTDIPVQITGILLEIDHTPHSVSFVVDISDRKETERQQRKMEEKMREAQKLESLGTLAGGIAHDFNNILSAILGYADLALLRCPTDDKFKAYLSNITRAGLRAKNLIQQILSFSRQGRSEKRLMDIGRVVIEAMQFIKATLPANIEIVENISPDLAPVLADDTQIHQVIMNLCTNAYHAMHLKGGVLNVSLAAVTIQEQDAQSYAPMDPGSYLKLSIADTGCGIPVDTINRIFDPYFTTKPIGEGTGLGLAAVHGIVKDHRGTIRVYSEVGVGTVFHILLPTAGDMDTTTDLPAGQLPTGSERILFVDDEATLIELGQGLLEQLGYQVETRASAIDAIAAFRADPTKYDLIITDMTMPKMTGDVMSRQIKAIRPDIPIIVCSGFSGWINARAMEAIGVSAVLMKPVLYADLARTIRQVLDADS